MVIKLEKRGEHLLKLLAAKVLSRAWREGERRATKHKAPGKSWRQDDMTAGNGWEGEGKQRNKRCV